MSKRPLALLLPSVFAVAVLAVLPALLQSGASGQDAKKEPDKKDFPFGKKKFGGFMGGPGGKQLKVVAKFDRNGDGWLNQEERAAAREYVKKQGGGKGGFGGPKKIGFGGASLTEPLLAALDANQDEKLAPDELLDGLKKFFAAADKDKQGSLDEERLAENLNRILPAPKGPPGGPKDGPPFGGKKGEFRRFGPGNFFARGLLERGDSNKDGKVTLAELTAAAKALFQEADKDKDGRLDETELGAAVALLMPGPGGFGPPGMGRRDPPRPGPRVTPADVTNHPKAPLYEPTVLRTLFLEFENKDWEAELADFRNTDVDVPAVLTVDGKTYPNVGVHFRGMSSYFAVSAGYKRSLNLSLDLADRTQRLYGYSTLNLLNSHGDPSFLRAVLYSHIARKFIPAPKVNLVKVVINGESWGIYANAQQFNREFIKENFNTTKGARWKVPGPGGGSLEYLGDDIAAYKGRYQIKTKDNARSWKALVTLCKTLNQTPPDRLEAALAPMLDIDGALRFLALDCALINNDGYWTRASDYSLYLDPKGKFHIIPHDMNEALQPAMGFGMFPKGGFGPKDRKGPKDGKGEKGDKFKKEGPFPGKFEFPFPGGPGGFSGKGGVELDPLVGLDNPRAALRSKLLAVPSLKKKYLQYVREVADELDWKKLGPVVAQYRALIEKEVEADTRKLTPLEAFRVSVADDVATSAGPGRGPTMSLRAFAEQRRRYLLNHPEVKTAAR